MDKVLLNTLAEIIREQVTRKNDVELDGLGILKIEHVPQHKEEYRNGQVVMLPPEDKLTFTPVNDNDL